MLQPCCYKQIHTVKSSLPSGAVNSGTNWVQAGSAAGSQVCNMPGLTAACHLHTLFSPLLHTFSRSAGKAFSCRGRTQLPEPAQSKNVAGPNGKGRAAQLVVVFLTCGAVFKHVRRPRILEGCHLVLVLRKPESP